MRTVNADGYHLGTQLPRVQLRWALRLATGRRRPMVTPDIPLVQLWDLEWGDQVVDIDIPAFWCALSPVELCFAAVGEKASGCSAATVAERPRSRPRRASGQPPAPAQRAAERAAEQQQARGGEAALISRCSSRVPICEPSRS